MILAKGPTTVDVVSIARNDLSGLQQAHESVENQDYRCLRWYVVDGASIDGTEEWLKGIHSQRLHRYVSEPDGGIYDAMNKGAAMGKGDLVVFLNSGDAFAWPGAVSTLVEAFEETNGDWGFGLTRVADNGQFVGLHSFHPFSRRLFWHGINSIPHQSAYVTRQVFEELGGFQLGAGFAADQEFFLRLSARTDPVLIWSVLATRSAGGITWQRPATAFPLDMWRFRRQQGLTTGRLGVVDALMTGVVIVRQLLAAQMSRVAG